MYNEKIQVLWQVPIFYVKFVKNYLELVYIINQFREEEFRILKEKGLNEKDKYSELQHYDFMKKIRKELKTLKALGFNTEGNFSLVEYTDKKGEQRPCFSLNSDGTLK